MSWVGVSALGLTRLTPARNNDVVNLDPLDQYILPAQATMDSTGNMAIATGSDAGNADGADWLDVGDALARLGVARQTLYAYVSRGLIRSRPADDDPRRSLYDRHAVETLIARRRRGRSRNAIAASTIDWGEPVLVSRITRIESGRLDYRGQDAVALSQWATLEDVAALLWEAPSLPHIAPPRHLPPKLATPMARCLAAAAQLATPATFDRGRRALLSDATRLLAWMTAAVAGTHSGRPAHITLAEAWQADVVASDILRRALVLCADHELNASTFAVRVAASTGASLPACLLAGLATLSGPLHGGVTDRLRAMLAEPGLRRDPARSVAARLGRGEEIPGFGQRLYPKGDPRAAALFAAVPANRTWRRLVDSVEEQTGRKPNIDAALVMLEDVLHLPVGTAFALFAVGRTAGWIAHAMEQRQDGRLIRPRAVYAGREPQTSTP
jgi:citrate synthase